MRVLRIIPYNPLQSVWKKSIPVIPVYLPPADHTDDSDLWINNVNDVNKKNRREEKSFTILSDLCGKRINPLQSLLICVRLS